jgi:phosphopantothenoylcysteine decarboxylase/phosphopantothenate--cysteine ligase
MKLLLIVTGSIAIVKIPAFLSLCTARAIPVDIIMSAAAKEFITPLALTSLIAGRVYSDLFSQQDEEEMGHIALTRKADSILVAPASADFIARMAQGRADDLASSALLANPGKPVFVAPAMNQAMWHHPATKRNLAQIMQDGARLIPPTDGLLACGETGIGKMAEPETILTQILSI